MNPLFFLLRSTSLALCLCRYKVIMPTCNAPLASGKFCQRSVKNDGENCKQHQNKIDKIIESPVVHNHNNNSNRPISSENVINTHMQQQTLYSKTSVKAEISRLKKQLNYIEDPYKDAKRLYYEQHKKDPNIINEIRSRLMSVNLYTSDPNIPWQLIKMATDHYFELERSSAQS